MKSGVGKSANMQEIALRRRPNALARKIETVSIAFARASSVLIHSRARNLPKRTFHLFRNLAAQPLALTDILHRAPSAAKAGGDCMPITQACESNMDVGGATPFSTFKAMPHFTSCHSCT